MILSGWPEKAESKPSGKFFPNLKKTFLLNLVIQKHMASLLLCTYKFVACLYMLCDVLHTLAKLQSSLHIKNLDLSMVPAMVQTTVGRLKELKDYPSNSTWFKDHLKVFSDQKQLGQMKVQITELDRKSFIQGVYNPYIQSVKYLEWNDLV